MQLFETFNYDKWIKLEDEIEVMLTNTGHLVEIAAVHCKLMKTERLLKLHLSEM